MGQAQADEEEWAFGILHDHLVADGHTVECVRRPDLANRSTRDVDFLVEFDGREVAIEVTRLDQERQWWVLLKRLRDAIRAELIEWPESAPGLVVELRLLRVASYREVDQVALAIAELARSWAREPGPSITQVFADLVQVKFGPRSGRGLGFISQSEAHDSRLDPRAAEFVQGLVEKKGEQARSYSEVWLIVIDTEVLIGVDLLAQAFVDAAAIVPANWKRLYFLPATNRSDVQCIALG